MLQEEIYRRTGGAVVDGYWSTDDQLWGGSLLANDTVRVVGWMLQTVVASECLVANPSALVGQRTIQELEQRRQNYLAEVAREMGPITGLAWLHQAGVEIRSQTLSGEVSMEWRAVGPSRLPELSGYTLAFIGALDHRPRRTLDVLVRWASADVRIRDKLPPARWRGGGSHRRLFQGNQPNVFEALEPYTLKRLYLPVYGGRPTALQVRRSVDDMFALLLLYLVRGKVWGGPHSSTVFGLR